jgi:hypothetical protein
MKQLLLVVEVDDHHDEVDEVEQKYVDKLN